jgi:DNA-binding GntR family transcriptional regulator
MVVRDTAERRSELAKMREDGVGLAPMTNVESAEYAADQIRDAIITGRYKPGDRLVEKQLTDQLNISRHPVREALRRLSREGFVEVRINRGAIVATLEASSILEVYELRGALGSMALRHLLANGKSLKLTDLKRLEKLAKNAIVLSKQDSQEATVANDLEFQNAIIEAADLPRTARYFAELTGEVQRFNNFLRIVYTERESDAKNYVFRLFEAIRDRDLSQAETIWKAKFAQAVERYLSLVAPGPSDGNTRG